MSHRHFSRGETICRTGEPVENLIVVASGRLKLIHTSPGGREQVVRMIGPGEFVGELGLLAPATHDGDLVAADDTQACILGREAVQKVLRGHPDAALRLVGALAERLARAEQRIGDLGLKDVGSRLAAELVRAAEHALEDSQDDGTAGMAAADSGARPCCSHGATMPGRTARAHAGGGAGVTVQLPGTWAELAARIGTTPESLSRRLKELVDEGILRRHGSSRQVVILRLDELRRRAQKEI